MLTKITSTWMICVMIVLSSVERASAQSTVAFVFDAPDGMFSELDKLHSDVQLSIENILFASGHHIVLEIDETSSYLQLYRVENDLVLAMNNGSGVVTLRPLKRADFDAFCEHFG